MSSTQEGIFYDQQKLRFSPLITGTALLLIIFGYILFKPFTFVGYLLMGAGFLLLVYLFFLISKTAILTWKISNSGELKFIVGNKEYLLKKPTEINYGFRKDHVKGVVYQYRLYGIFKSDQLNEPLILTEELPAGRNLPDYWEEIHEIPPSTKVYGNSNGFMLKKSNLPHLIELLKN